MIVWPVPFLAFTAGVESSEFPNHDTALSIELASYTVSYCLLLFPLAINTLRRHSLKKGPDELGPIVSYTCRSIREEKKAFCWRVLVQRNGNGVPRERRGREAGERWGVVCRGVSQHDVFDRGRPPIFSMYPAGLYGTRKNVYIRLWEMSSLGGEKTVPHFVGKVGLG